MSDDDLIRKLESTHASYDEEALWHRFLLDAASGGGGFQGSVQQPQTSVWGPAAEAYSAQSFASRGKACLPTYLDQFPREDENKFKRRRDVAHYANYIEPIQGTKLSYMHRKEFTRELPPEIEAWSRDVDGAGASMDELRVGCIDQRAANLGWMPTLLDFSRVVPEGITQAQADELGARINLIPLFPANLPDWETNERGGFTWAKTRITRRERPDPMGPARTVTKYCIWTPATVRVWEVVEQDGDSKKAVNFLGENRNPFGEVPIVIARHKPLTDDPVRGVAMCASSAVQAKRLFNVISEKDEHLRSAVFAMLQIPAKDMATLGAIVGGNGNALRVDPDSSRDCMWIAPPSTVYQTLADEEAALVKSMYVMERMEVPGAEAGGTAESGTARAYKFEQTNRSIADFARQLATFEAQVYRLVGKGMGLSSEQIESIRVTAPDKFAVDEMAAAIKEAMDSVTLNLGKTGNALVKKRLVDAVLPNLPPAIRTQIDAEIDALEASKEVAAQKLAESAEAPGKGDDPPPDNTDEDELDQRQAA